MNSEPPARLVEPLKSRIPVPVSCSLKSTKNNNVKKDELKGPEKKLIKNALKQCKGSQPRTVSKTTIKPPEVKESPGKATKDTRKNIVQSSKTKITLKSKRTEKPTVIKKLTFPSKKRNDHLLTAKNAPLEKESKSLLLSIDYQKQKVKNVSNSKSNFELIAVQHRSGDEQNLFQGSELPSNQATKVESSITAEKENKVSTKPNYLESQKDIKFEADEKYRKMILSGVGFSPKFGRCSDRMSIYDVALEIPANPREHALKAIEDWAKSDRKTSLIGQSKPVANLSPYKLPGASIYNTALEIPLDPKKEALKAIENLSKSEKKASAAVNLSPFKAHSSLNAQSNFFNTPPHTDPKEWVKRSLAAMKQERLTKSNAAKSTKKVTFNLNVEEYTPRQKINFNPTPFKTEGRLSQINERSEENTPNTPLGKVCTANSSKPNQDEQKINSENVEMTHPLQSINCDYKTYPKANKDHEFRTPQIKLPIQSGSHYTSIKTLSENVTEEINNSVIQSLKKFNLNYLSQKDPDTRTTCDFLPKNNEEIFSQNSVQFVGKQKNSNTTGQICTPKPISLYPKSSSVDDSEDLSPEFLVDYGNYKLISQNAPICTPLVLRSLAKNTILTPVENLSPVRLKLDFTEEKDSPKAEDVSKTLVPAFVDNIVTAQKQLDELADKECSFYLCDEAYPVLYNRSLLNPISRTLTEGDEMHFVPLA